VGIIPTDKIFDGPFAKREGISKIANMIINDEVFRKFARDFVISFPSFLCSFFRSNNPPYIRE
jgi:hypothetical protein